MIGGPRAVDDSIDDERESFRAISFSLSARADLIDLLSLRTELAGRSEIAPAAGAVGVYSQSTLYGRYSSPSAPASSADFPFHSRCN